MFPGYVRYAGGDQGWMQELVANGAESVKQYGQWIANRYKKKNIVWMLLGDMGTFTTEQKKCRSLVDQRVKKRKKAAVCAIQR